MGACRRQRRISAGPALSSAVRRTVRRSRRNGARSPGGAAGHDARPVAVAPERGIEGPEFESGQPVERFQRQPGEPGAARHDGEAGGAGAQHGRGAPAGLPEQAVEQALEGGRRVGCGCRGHVGCGCRGVEVDPGPGREVAGGGSGSEQRMAGGGDDGGCQVEEALAPQEGRRGMAGIGAAEVEVVPTVLQQAQALGERRGAQDEPDAGRQFAEGGGGRGVDDGPKVRLFAAFST